MGNQYVSAAWNVGVFVAIVIVSVLLGLAIGLATIRWWTELMFEDVYGAPVVLVVVLPVAFLVPFIASLITQLCIWFYVGRKAIKTQS